MSDFLQYMQNNKSINITKTSRNRNYKSLINNSTSIHQLLSNNPDKESANLSRNITQNLPENLPSEMSTISNNQFIIEKYNSKLNVWFPKILKIDDSNLYFYYINDTTNRSNILLNSNLHPNKYSEYLEICPKTKIKKYHFLKIGNKNKNFVLSFQMDISTVKRCYFEDDSYNCYISAKNENLWNYIFNILQDIIKVKNTCNTNNTSCNTINTSKFNTALSNNNNNENNNHYHLNKKRNLCGNLSVDFNAKKSVCNNNNNTKNKDINSINGALKNINNIDVNNKMSATYRNSINIKKDSSKNKCTNVFINCKSPTYVNKTNRGKSSFDIKKNVISNNITNNGEVPKHRLKKENLSVNLASSNNNKSSLPKPINKRNTTNNFNFKSNINNRNSNNFHNVKNDKLNKNKNKSVNDIDKNGKNKNAKNIKNIKSKTIDNSTNNKYINSKININNTQFVENKINFQMSNNDTIIEKEENMSLIDLLGQITSTSSSKINKTKKLSSAKKINISLKNDLNYLSKKPTNGTNSIINMNKLTITNSHNINNTNNASNLSNSITRITSTSTINANISNISNNNKAIINNVSNSFYLSNNNTNLSTVNFTNNKRKDQINQIINMSLISNNTSYIQPKNNNNNKLNYSLVENCNLNLNNNINNTNIINNNNTTNILESIHKSKKTKITCPITLGKVQNDEDEEDEQEKSKKESEKRAIANMISQIDNCNIYIYDPYILKEYLKQNNFSMRDISKLFLLSQKENIKRIFLIEMISKISKKFLSESIIKSIEVVLKEKELNPSYIINSLSPHSFEYCICDVFNTFLSTSENNKYSYELYSQILPVYLNENFNIPIDIAIKETKNLYNLKNSRNTLFSYMQYYNKIYFNNNKSIKFEEEYPLKTTDIKYVSAYYINKWNYKAIEFNNNSLIFLSSNKKKSFLGSSNKKTNNFNTSGFSYSSDSPSKCKKLTTTNLKRFKNFMLNNNNESTKIDIISQIQNFKMFELSNDNNRIYLINSIYDFINKKQYQFALKLCDFYIQKYNYTLFLNTMIYLYLSEIYSEIDINNNLSNNNDNDEQENINVEYAKAFFNKALNIINWLYPNEECHFLFDLYYNFMLILLKQNDRYIKNNFEYIKSIIDTTEKYSLKYYNQIHCQVKLQKIIFKLNYENNYNNNSQEMSKDEIVKIFNDIKESMKQMKDEGIGNNNKGLALYWDLFIDLFKNFKNCPDDINKEVIRLYYEANK